MTKCLFEVSLTTSETAGKVLMLVKNLIPNSSTRESLRPEGYPVAGDIEQTIHSYQKTTLNSL